MADSRRSSSSGVEHPRARRRVHARARAPSATERRNPTGPRVAPETPEGCLPDPGRKIGGGRARYHPRRFCIYRFVISGVRARVTCLPVFRTIRSLKRASPFSSPCSNPAASARRVFCFGPKRRRSKREGAGRDCACANLGLRRYNFWPTLIRRD